MTLSPIQMQHTRSELKQNFDLTGLSKEQVATDLNISEVKLDKLFLLKQRSLDDPWILRNYLIQKVTDLGKTPVTFTALKGDWHDYWFLNSRVIDNRQITPGDN